MRKRLPICQAACSRAWAFPKRHCSGSATRRRLRSNAKIRSEGLIQGKHRGGWAAGAAAHFVRDTHLRPPAQAAQGEHDTTVLISLTRVAHEAVRLCQDQGYLTRSTVRVPS